MIVALQTFIKLSINWSKLDFNELRVSVDRPFCVDVCGASKVNTAWFGSGESPRLAERSCWIRRSLMYFGPKPFKAWRTKSRILKSCPLRVVEQGERPQMWSSFLVLARSRAAAGFQADLQGCYCSILRTIRSCFFFPGRLFYPWHSFFWTESIITSRFSGSPTSYLSNESWSHRRELVVFLVWFWSHKKNIWQTSAPSCNTASPSFNDSLCQERTFYLVPL